MNTALAHGLALAAALLLAAGAASGGAAGRDLYVGYCAPCHGIDGRGGGPEAGDSLVPPPDLTRLHERYGTPLDRERVAAFIDGREDVSAHGPRDMPVWGERLFEGDAGPPQGVESAKRRAIDLLVDYLQKLQGHDQARLSRRTRCTP